jgi:hypothetical protein
MLPGSGEIGGWFGDFPRLKGKTPIIINQQVFFERISSARVGGQLRYADD